MWVVFFYLFPPHFFNCLNCHSPCLSCFTGIPQVANPGSFYKLQRLHKGLKSLDFLGSIECNISGIAGCAFLSARLIGAEELIPPPVSLSAWLLLIALWSASPRALAICRRQISRHAEQGEARETKTRVRQTRSRSPTQTCFRMNYLLRTTGNSEDLTQTASNCWCFHVSWIAWNDL